MATDTTLDGLCINTIRTLAMDGVQKANSGHPGTAMAMAPVMHTLWDRFLRFNPRNPRWLNRDRFGKVRRDRQALAGFPGARPHPGRRRRIFLRQRLLHHETGRAGQPQEPAETSAKLALLIGDHILDPWLQNPAALPPAWRAMTRSHDLRQFYLPEWCAIVTAG